MRTVNLSSALGPDGIGFGFYKALWKVTGPILVKLRNFIAESGELTQVAKRRHLVLIPKGAGNNRISNTRPISLINADVRIIAKIDTLRLKAYIGDLVHPNQTGFIPERSISTNIADVQLLFYQKQDSSGYLAFIDFKKAYDRVDHEWMGLVLRAKNFPPTFRRTLLAYVKGGSANVVLNGSLGTTFKIKAGVPQGSPIACFL